jgi:hypothetical protein
MSQQTIHATNPIIHRSGSDGGGTGRRVRLHPGARRSSNEGDMFRKHIRQFIRPHKLT